MTDHFANMIDREWDEKCFFEEHGMTEREARRLARDEKAIEDHDRERRGLND